MKLQVWCDPDVPCFIRVPFREIAQACPSLGFAFEFRLTWLHQFQSSHLYSSLPLQEGEYLCPSILSRIPEIHSDWANLGYTSHHEPGGLACRKGPAQRHAQSHRLEWQRPESKCDGDPLPFSFPGQLSWTQLILPTTWEVKRDGTWWPERLFAAWGRPAAGLKTPARAGTYRYDLLHPSVLTQCWPHFSTLPPVKPLSFWPQHF